MKASLVPKAWQGYPFNTIQPQQTVTGRVIYKRTTATHSPTDYFVTLQLHGARKEFSVDADAYGQLTVGDSGSITYQGNWLLQFARHSRRGWEVIQSQPQKGPVWRLVFISLVVVVFIALMMGGCGSDETKPPDPDPDPDESLIGSWERFGRYPVGIGFDLPEDIKLDVTEDKIVFTSSQLTHDRDYGLVGTWTHNGRKTHTHGRRGRKNPFQPR